MFAKRTITLFGGGPAFGLPEASPYVTKTEVQLKMAGIPYVKEFARPELSPKGQLPFIEDGGVQIADSTFIRAHLERAYCVDLDEGLSTFERAQAWAIERMIEDQLGWVSAHARFMVPENFKKGPAQWFAFAPEGLRAKMREELRAAVAANLRAVGIARHSPAEIWELGARSLGALSALLGDKPYLMGESESGVDAAAFGALAGVLTPFFDSPLRRAAEAHVNLVEYVDLMMAQYYPEHRWGQPSVSCFAAAAATVAECAA
jgi:glutathione S-transferase